EGEGIPVLVAGDTTGGAFPGMGGAFNAVHLQVDEENYQKALNLLESADKEPLDEDDTITTQITDHEPDGADQDTSGYEITAAAKKSDDRQLDSNITTQPKRQRKHRRRERNDAADFQIQWGPDDYARRAWLAAMFGLMCAAFAACRHYLPMQIDFIA